VVRGLAVVCVAYFGPAPHAGSASGAAEDKHRRVCRMEFTYVLYNTQIATNLILINNIKHNEQKIMIYLMMNTVPWSWRKQRSRGSVMEGPLQVLKTTPDPKVSF
jgi:hypothetical protein